jgi:4-amino-4-deoxy-L-arabinose transferase-like glycosyltransferase
MAVNKPGGLRQMPDRRLGLCIAAGAMTVLGVLTGSLWLIGGGVVAIIAACYGISETYALPRMAGHHGLLIGALLLSAVTCILTYQDFKNPVINLLWLMAMIMYTIAALRFDRATPVKVTTTPHDKKFLSKHVLVMPVILIAFALRFYNLETLPPLHGDEGEMGLAALKVLENQAPPPTAVGWMDHPALFHYLQAGPVAIFGRTGLALRILSVVAGVLCVPLVYKLGRRGWGAVAGLAAAWLITVSHLHIHFSRIGLNNIESTLAMLLFLALISRIRPGRMTVAAVSGLVVGLAQYLYYGSRVIPLVAVVLLFVFWRKKMVNLKQVAALGLGVLIAFVPLGTFYVSHPDAFVSRSRGVFVLTEQNVKHTLHSDMASVPHDLLPLLKEQVNLTLNFFVKGGDRSAFYTPSVPGFDLLTIILFWLGLGLALTRLRRFHETAILIWLGLGLLFGGILTNDAPNAPRLLIVVPAVFLLAGALLHQAGRLLLLYPQKLKVMALGLILAVAGLLNLKIYFHDFEADLPPRNVTSDFIAREIKAAGPADDVFLLGRPHLSVKYGTIHFLGGDTAADLVDAADVPAPNGRGLLVIALPDQTENLEAIEQRIPGGTLRTRVNQRNDPIYTVYHVSARPQPGDRLSELPAGAPPN